MMMNLKIALALAAVCWLALVAHAWAGPNDWPGMSTNVIRLDGNKNQTNDGCRNYALGIMGKLSFQNIMTAGENTTAGVATIEDHDYVVTVRCQVENKVVLFVAAGLKVEHASKLLDLFLTTWTNNGEPATKTSKKERRS